MDQQIQAEISYKSALTPEQKVLLEAVEEGKLDIVQRFFRRLPETIRRTRGFDYVLLTTAVKREHRTVLKFLLNSGCRTRIEEKTNFLCTPLYYAIEKNYVRIIGELVKLGASIRDTDLDEVSPLQYAVQTDKMDIIEAILRSRKHILSHEKLDPNSKWDLAVLQTACYKNNLVAVKELLELKFPINLRSSFSSDEWKGFTLLHFSLSGPKGSTVDLLLKSGVDILAEDEKGRTAMHLALRNTDKGSYGLGKSNLLKNWVREIFDKDFSNPEDENGLSHFHIICCGYDDKDSSKGFNAVQFFLENKVNVNKSISLDDPDYPGYTALHFAVRHVRLNITKLLLENGADVTKTDKDGLTPLHLACDRSLMPSYRIPYRSKDSSLEADRLEIAELLLKYGADVDAQDLRGSTPIHYALSRITSKTNEDGATGQSLTRMLVSKSKLNANYTDSHGLTYLHIASSTDLAAMKTLVENGASLNSCVNANGEFKPGYSALHFAIFYGKVEIVEYLLKNGVDPNMRINHDTKLAPLHLVCNFTYSEAYYSGEKSKDDSNYAGQLHQTDKIRIIELLLKHGALINAKDLSGNTPLFTACVLPPYSSHKFEYGSSISERVYLQQQAMIQVLLENGADVRLRNIDERSVLHMIVRESKGHSCDQKISLARLILTKGADINARDNKGVTPLHEAVRNSMAEEWDSSLIQFFLDCGAKVNAESPNFGTALHIALRKYSSREPNHEKVLLCLLDCPKIDVNARNSSGDTPLHIAGNNLASACFSYYFIDNDKEKAMLKTRSCIEKLLAAGADLNTMNDDELMPMHEVYSWLQSYSSRSHENYLDILAFVITQMKKLLKINVSVSEDIREELYVLSNLHIERSLAVDTAIDEELDKLKSKKVDQYTSLYDILLKNVNEVSKHVKNEDLKKMITAPELSTEFPIYHEILIRKFRVGSTRSLILEPAKEALGNVLRVSWPDSCSEHILKYLSNDSLKRLIKSISIRNVRKRPRQNEATHLDEPKFKTRRF